MKNSHPDMAAILLLLHHLGYSGHLLKVAFSHDLQVCSQDTRVVCNHPLLDITVLQDIEYLMTDTAQHVLALRVRLKQLKIFLLCTPVAGIAQRRRLRIPRSRFLKPVVGLGSKKVGKENIPPSRARTIHRLAHTGPAASCAWSRWNGRR